MKNYVISVDYEQPDVSTYKAFVILDFEDASEVRRFDTGDSAIDAHGCGCWMLEQDKDTVFLTNDLYNSYYENCRKTMIWDSGRKDE